MIRRSMKNLWHHSNEKEGLGGVYKWEFELHEISFQNSLVFF